jgi:glycosyltransferase involved in cell wall biosynthesis
LLPIAKNKPYLRSVIPPNPFSALQFVRDVQAWKPDVGHLHGYGYGLVDFASVVFRRIKIPYVFTNHGYPVTPLSRSLVTRTLYRAYEAIAARPTTTNSYIATSISESVAQKSRPMKIQSVVIENGVSPLPTPSCDDRKRMQDRLQLGNSSVIGAAGRLSPSKGFDVLLASLQQLHHRPVTCVVAGGDGGELSSLSRQASTLPKDVRVVFPGQMNRDDLGTIFSLSDVVAVPSRDEPFGLVALEAMAMGRRVVATDTGGLRTFVTEPLGTLVPPDAPTALAAALDSALTAPNTQRETDQQHTLLAERSWDIVAAKYERVLVEASSDTLRRNETNVR